ncbi:MAG TPA: MarR family transcriptional regulator [Alphaproteobacteria bacterium]|nr:MarR family transcriptional regulator [Alphaproteobacteria bacterium]
MNYLDNQLCVQLYIKTRAIIRFHEKQLKLLGLTYPQALVLLALEEKSPCYIDEVATRLLLDIGTLSPLLKKMEKGGYIKKKRGEKDERRVFISLTSLGEKSIEPIKRVFEKTSAAICLPPSTKQEMLTHIRFVNFTE